MTHRPLTVSERGVSLAAGPFQRAHVRGGGEAAERGGDAVPERALPRGRRRGGHALLDGDAARGGVAEEDEFHGGRGVRILRVDALVRKQGRRSIGWEEVFVHHAATLPKDTLVQIWLGDGEGLKNVVHAGFDAIVSNYKHWYLPQLWETWDYYYGNDLWTWERTVT